MKTLLALALAVVMLFPPACGQLLQSQRWKERCSVLAAWDEAVG
jgi:hypothetical protein